MVMNNACVTFGTFEFVHIGHRRIAEQVVEIAKARGLTSVVVSMEKEGEVYTTEEEKEYLLKSLGVEMILSFREIGIKELLRILMAKVVVVGANCKQLEELQSAAEELGIELVVLPTVEYKGQEVTAELVETAFEASDFGLVKELCGHPYIMIGEVVHGKALGRTASMPTANIQVPDEKVKPGKAVYGARILLGEEQLDTVTHVGKRPTVDNDDHITIEALILNFNREIYGEKLVLEIHGYIRGTRKFENLAEVKEQVDKDILVAERILRK